MYISKSYKWFFQQNKSEAQMYQCTILVILWTYKSGLK